MEREKQKKNFLTIAGEEKLAVLSFRGVVLFFKGTEYCRTLHIMDSRGISVMVEKHCAAAAECEEHNVGCLPMDGQQVTSTTRSLSFCRIKIASVGAVAMTYGLLLSDRFVSLSRLFSLLFFFFRTLKRDVASALLFR